MKDLNNSPDYMAVSAVITDLTAKLTPFVQQYSAELGHYKRDKGKKFDAKVVLFVKKINKLEKDYTEEIWKAANRISGLAKKGWEENSSVITLWQQLAGAASLFSEHPTKKNAALIISEDNSLISFSANRVPPGIKRHAKHYEKDIRKEFIICGERMAAAKAMGLKVHSLPKLRKIRGRHFYDLERAAIRNFSDDIAFHGKDNETLRNTTLLSLVTPCDTCFPAIAAIHPKQVFADSRMGDNYTRNVGFERVRENLAGVGVPLRNLALGG